jgi:hypothetical protein
MKRRSLANDRWPKLDALGLFAHFDVGYSVSQPQVA